MQDSHTCALLPSSAATQIVMGDIGLFFLFYAFIHHSKLLMGGLQGRRCASCLFFLSKQLRIVLNFIGINDGYAGFLVFGRMAPMTCIHSKGAAGEIRPNPETCFLSLPKVTTIYLVELSLEVFVRSLEKQSARYKVLALVT